MKAKCEKKIKGSNVVSLKQGIERLLKQQEGQTEAEKSRAMRHKLWGVLTNEDLARLEIAFDRRLALALRANRC